MNEQRPRSHSDSMEALAFRGLHEARLLQPRRASLFEAGYGSVVEPEPQTGFAIAELVRPRPAPVPEPMPAATLGPVAAEPRTTMPSRPTSDVANPGRAAQSGGSEPTVASAAHERRPPIAIEAAAAARPLAQGSHVEPARRSAPVRNTLAPVARTEQPHRPDEAAPDRVRRSWPRHAPPRAPVLVPREAPHEAEAAFHVAVDRAPLPAPEPQRERAAPAGVSAAVSGSRQGAMVPRRVPDMRQLTPLFPAPPKPATDERVVEITIGRLEIRVAAPPAAPALRTAPAPPQQSLHDYLSRTTAEGRG